MAGEWKMFLDDDADGLRHPTISVENPQWRNAMALPLAVPETSKYGDWKIARNYEEAAALFIEYGLPSFVSFDHDLGDRKDGIAVVNLMIEIDLDHGALPDDFRFEVHSGNPVGRTNIKALWKSYLDQRDPGLSSPRA